MKSFVEALYYGNLVPWERGRPQDPKYTPINRRIDDIEEHFRKTLPPEEQERFKELRDLHIQSSFIQDTDAFAYGLNMGMLLVIEAMNFKENRLK